jgi:hypothetical protein
MRNRLSPKTIETTVILRFSKRLDLICVFIGCSRIPIPVLQEWQIILGGSAHWSANVMLMCTRKAKRSGTVTNIVSNADIRE